MKLYNAILRTDEEIADTSSNYVFVYKMVKEFVDRYNLQDRKIGSRLGYYLNVSCEGDTRPNTGYYFEITVKENLIESMVNEICGVYGKNIDKLIKSNCNLSIVKGL